jgi:hypothetical protein
MPSYSTLLLSQETQTRRNVIGIGWKGSIKQERFNVLSQQFSYVRGHSHILALGTDGFDKLNLSPLFPARVWALTQMGLIFVLMTA